jgi:hypothetical protein
LFFASLQFLFAFFAFKKFQWFSRGLPEDSFDLGNVRVDLDGRVRVLRRRR